MPNDVEELTQDSQESKEVVAAATPAVHVIPIPKPSRNKTRTLEELDALSAKTMTDAERIKYIDGLRDTIASLNTTVGMYKHNCDMAYEKCRQLEQAKEETQMKFNTEMGFVRQAIDTCHRSIILATRRES